MVRKKIYTHMMDAQVEITADNAPVGNYDYIGADTWNPQDDVTLIGFEIKTWPEHVIDTDSTILMMTELSQVGKIGADGIIGRASSRYFRHMLAGAQDIDLMNLDEGRSVMFPDNAGFSVPEGDTLYLNLSMRIISQAISIGWYWSAVVILYFVKGLAT